MYSIRGGHGQSDPSGIGQLEGQFIGALHAVLVGLILGGEADIRIVADGTDEAGSVASLYLMELLS